MRLRPVHWSLLGALLACDEGDAHFTVRFASDFSPARHQVSVLGVYRDGRMSEGAWELLAPRLAPALGRPACEVAYDELLTSDQPLADAVNDVAQEQGPTDDLLATLAPAARGDLVLVITFAGDLPAPADAGAGRRPPSGSQGSSSSAASAPGSAPPATPGIGRGAGRTGGHRGGGGLRRGPEADRASDGNALQIAASVFSVAQRRSVALVAMQYSGSSLDDAIARFAAKLAHALPDAACAGWSWDSKIDPGRVRAVVEGAEDAGE